MSLINDALKRASTSRPMLSEAAVVPIMHPVAEPARGTGPLPIVLFIVGVGALLVSGGFWLKSKGTPVETATAVIPEPVRIATPAPAPALVAVEKLVTTNIALPAVTATVAAEAPAPSPVVIVSEPAVDKPVEKITIPSPALPKPAIIAAKPVEQTPIVEAQPELSLQAIYYRMKGPTVVINGKTLKPGDKIEGAKLVVIERNAAIVEFQGTHRRLTIQ